MTDLTTPYPTPCGITREKVSCTRQKGHTGIHRVGRPLGTIRREDDGRTVTCMALGLLGSECLGEVTVVIEGMDFEPRETHGVWLWCPRCFRWIAAPKKKEPEKKRRRR